MTISDAVQTQINITLTPAFGYLNVASQPAGASVYLDNREVGQTPLVEYRIPSGDYVLSVKKEYYKDHQAQISIEDGQTLDQTLDLSADYGSLSVQGSPPGAAVFVDGVKRGTLPGTIEPLGVGSHMVSIDAGDHYRSQVQPVFVRLNEQTDIQVVLKELTGSLLASSKPQGASIFIDGDRLESRAVTPYTIPKLWVGKHKVTLDLAGFAPVTRFIDIREDQRELLSADLERLIYVKPRSQALWRSAIVPGFGQYYAGRTQAGGAFVSIEALLLGLFLIERSDYVNLTDDYETIRNQYESFQGTAAEISAKWREVEETYDLRDDKYRQQQLTVGLMAGVYLWNIADTWLFMPRRTESSLSTGLSIDGHGVSATLQVSLP